MLRMDKNGREIRTGDVVCISGAYFKGDNGLWLVKRSPGEKSWSGSDYSLLRLNKNGTLKGRNSVGFWPIMVTVTGYDRRREARAWNKLHAEIEIVDNVDRRHVIAYFMAEAEDADSRADNAAMHYGEDSTLARIGHELAAHYRAVAARIA